MIQSCHGLIKINKISNKTQPKVKNAPTEFNSYMTGTQKNTLSLKVPGIFPKSFQVNKYNINLVCEKLRQIKHLKISAAKRQAFAQLIRVFYLLLHPFESLGGTL